MLTTSIRAWSPKDLSVSDLTTTSRFHGRRQSSRDHQFADPFCGPLTLKFMEPVSRISDGQLWQMAHDAFNEMAADAVHYGVKKDRPGAVTVLAFGNEINISSSMKGKGAFAYEYPQSNVVKALQLCQITWEAGGGGEDQLHKNSGNCGEVMAAQLHYNIHDAPLADQKARAGAVLVNKQQELKNTPPCGTDQDVSINWLPYG